MRLSSGENLEESNVRIEEVASGSMAIISYDEKRSIQAIATTATDSPTEPGAGGLVAVLSGVSEGESVICGNLQKIGPGPLVKTAIVTAAMGDQ